jgi:hypothetical protein
MDWQCGCGRVNDAAWLVCPGCEHVRPVEYSEPQRSAYPALPGGSGVGTSRRRSTLGRKIATRVITCCLLVAAVGAGATAWRSAKRAWNRTPSGPVHEAQQAPGVRQFTKKDLVGPKEAAERRLAAAIATPASEFKLTADRATAPQTILGNTDGTVRAYARLWRDDRGRSLITWIIEFANEAEAQAYSGAPRSQFATGIKGAIGLEYETQGGEYAAAIELHGRELVAICVLASHRPLLPEDIAMLKAYARKQAAALR